MHAFCHQGGHVEEVALLTFFKSLSHMRERNIFFLFFFFFLEAKLVCYNRDALSYSKKQI